MILNPLTSPLTGIIFDCDGTLSRIEGIDELAAANRVFDIVQRLTQEAMGKTGMTPEIYANRLSLTKPSLAQVKALALSYYQNMAADLVAVLAIFRRLQKSIYIVSAGLLPAVQAFGQMLEIPQENIYAVDIIFDHNNQYQDFDHGSPLVKKWGKQSIVEQIRQKSAELAFIGDGLSDLEVCHLVKRFVGYGGAFFRENIEKHCEFYIKSISMSPLLPMLLTENEVNKLTSVERKLYEKGLQIA